MQVYMTRNTQRKLRALKAWREQSMASIIADLIAQAYLDALVERSQPD